MVLGLFFPKFSKKLEYISLSAGCPGNIIIIMSKRVTKKLLKNTIKYLIFPIIVINQLLEDIR